MPAAPCRIRSAGTVGRARIVGVVGVVALTALLSSCGSDGHDAGAAHDGGGTTETVADTTTDATSDASTDDAPVAGDADADGGDAGVASNGEVVEVRALDNTFIAEEITVAAGTEVRWENRGRNDHDIVPVDDSQEWGVDLEDFTPGDAYSRVFTTPGVHRYYCTIHGTADVGMVGVVIVE